MKSPLLLVACATEIVASISTDFAVAGFRVRFAASGMDLLKYARRLRPDLIVLDPNLPDLANVCENLNQTPWTNSIPLILLEARPEASSEAVPFGGRLFGSLFDSEELIRRIKETLGVTSFSLSKAASGRMPRRVPEAKSWRS
jgi:DNA-binding response OmpR family regulator